jgi:hypothetical protein
MSLLGQAVQWLLDEASRGNPSGAGWNTHEARKALQDAIYISIDDGGIFHGENPSVEFLGLTFCFTTIVVRPHSQS